MGPGNIETRYEELYRQVKGYDPEEPSLEVPPGTEPVAIVHNDEPMIVFVPLIESSSLSQEPDGIASKI